MRCGDTSTLWVGGSLQVRYRYQPQCFREAESGRMFLCVNGSAVVRLLTSGNLIRVMNTSVTTRIISGFSYGNIGLHCGRNARFETVNSRAVVRIAEARCHALTRLVDPIHLVALPRVMVGQLSTPLPFEARAAMRSIFIRRRSFATFLLHHGQEHWIASPESSCHPSPSA